MTVAEIIAKWPSAEQFARDLGLKHMGHGRLMRTRNSIPARYWPDIIKASADRGFVVTLDDLRKANPGAVELVPVEQVIAAASMSGAAA